jgi:tape measure domain-containing protein
MARAKTSAATLSVQYLANTVQLLTGTKKAADAVAKGTSKINSHMNQMRSVIQGAMAAFSAREIVSTFTQTALAIERTTRTLEAATGSTKKAMEEYRFATDTAKKLGLEITSTIQSYAKFTAALKGSSIAGEQARKIFTAVSKANTVLGLSAEDARLTFLALEQMVSKGKVSMEELRRQLGERIPGAFQMAARSMGVTTAELDKLVSTGKLTADDLLPRFAEELERTFGDKAQDAAKGLQGKINDIKNAFFDLKSELLRLGIADGIKEMADWAKNLVGYLKTAVDYYSGFQGGGTKAPRSVQELRSLREQRRRVFMQHATEQMPGGAKPSTMLGMLGFTPQQGFKDIMKGKSVKEQADIMSRNFEALDAEGKRKFQQIDMQIRLAEKRAELGTRLPLRYAAPKVVPTTATALPGRSGKDILNAAEVEKRAKEEKSAQLKVTNALKREEEKRRSEAQRLISSFQTQEERLKSQLETAGFLREEGALTDSQFDSVAKRIRSAMDSIKDKTKETTDEMGRMFDRIAGSMADAITQFVTSGKMSFSGLVNSMIADIIRLSAQQLITQPLAESISKSLKNIFGGGRADGGRVSSSKAYVVGERGPELFMPGNSGNIVPNHALGGGNTSVVINDMRGAGAPPVSTTQRMKNGRREVEVTITDTVRKALRSGDLNTDLRLAMGGVM